MQKKFKFLKAFAGIIAASVMLSAVGFAEAPTATLDGDTISVTYSHEDFGFGTMVYVLSTKVEDSSTVNEEYLREHLVWIGKVSGGEVECILPEGSPYGAYTIIVGADGLSDVKSSRLAYLLNKEPGIDEEAISAITGAKTADAMAEQFEEYNNKAFMADLSKLEENKQLVFELVGNLGSGATVEAVAGCVTKAAELGSMKDMNEDEIAVMLEEKYKELGIDDDILLYSKAVAKAVEDEIDNCETIGDISALIEENLALVALNAAAPGKFLDVLDKYNSVFNVTLSSKLEKVSEYKIGKILADIEYTDVDDVEDQVNGAIEDLYDDGKKSNSGGGGGSFGGGGGYSASPTLTKPVVDEINENAVEEAAFSDLEGYDWAEEAIGALYKNGIISGDGDGNFRPGDGITREELTKILIVAFNDGKTVEKKLNFTDVSDEWYKPYIETAFSMGIVNGISEDAFGVGQLLTREDAAVMLQRTMDATYKEIVKKQTLVNFTDKDEISDYAMVSVDILARAQIFNGFEDGSFRPKNNITRAEIAKVVYGCLAQ